MSASEESFSSENNKIAERGLIRMAVMSQQVNLGFEVAPEKKEQFLREASSAKSFDRVMSRAVKNIVGFEKRTVKRK